MDALVLSRSTTCSPILLKKLVISKCKSLVMVANIRHVDKRKRASVKGGGEGG